MGNLSINDIGQCPEHKTPAVKRWFLRHPE
jgi:hypothetical protein